MTGNLEFQYPWLLALLALVPIYAFLRGRIGKLAALRFPSADIARAAGAAARAASCPKPQGSSPLPRLVPPNR